MKEIQQTLQSLVSIHAFSRSVQELGLQRVRSSTQIVTMNFSEEFGAATAQIPELHQKVIELKEQRVMLIKHRDRANKKLKRCLKHSSNAIKIVKQESAISYIDNILNAQADEIKKIDRKICDISRSLGDLLIRFGMLFQNVKEHRRSSRETSPSQPSPPQQAIEMPQIMAV